MRILLILLLFTGGSPPVFSARRLTVDQLEQVLSTAQGKSDQKVADQLSELQLTERLSPARLAHGQAELPGPASRQCLLVLADVSAFLDLPPSEIPLKDTPDLAAQRQIVAEAVTYAEKTISNLPNFFATRNTTYFEDMPQGHRLGTSLIPYQPLHLVGSSSQVVLYRDGREIVDSGANKHQRNDLESHGLITSGVFGPILGTVLVDATQGKLVWDHWEQSAGEPLAVFHFAIPKEKSHYQVQFCCLPEVQGTGIFQRFSGYHGEIAIDPTNGAIFRLTLQADLQRTDPLVRSNILVEYGPVEIGGKSYICPVKSVSIMLISAQASAMERYPGAMPEQEVTADPEQLRTLLNNVVFDQYHVFRAESRILNEDKR